jgi:hypothetical protein
MCALPALSSFSTLVTPSSVAASVAAAPTSLPSSATTISPPICLAAATTLAVAEFNLPSEISPITRILLIRRAPLL